MHHNHELWWHFKPPKELTLFYVSLTLRFFALSLVVLFIPLYLYQELGYTLNETLSFFIFYPVIFACMSPLAAKFASRFGVKHSVLFSMPFYIVFLILLHLLPKIKTPLMVLGLLVGFSLAFYWMGMHLVFHHASTRETRGATFGKRSAYKILATTLGPLLGGFLISQYGFGVVFILSSVLLFFSALILLLSEDNKVRYDFSLRRIVNKDHWKNSLFFISRGTEIVALDLVWPLLVFFILGGYVSLGAVGSLLAATSAIVVFLVGKFSDHVEKRKILRYITGFESLSWVLRSLVQTTTHVFGVTIFAAITSGIRASPMGAMEYDKADDDVVGYFVSREVFISLGRILMVAFVMMANSLSGGLALQAFLNLASFLF